ncbi:ABC transporter permease [Clostridium amazonitimonense]|uniref:ABC transporter permease n=1 Tax=Clostridium amazonitimonense TaxID=1499689 RepID=UPI000509A7CD|nr:ABC transporter permease [Clostridium amazonitimonense]
MLNVFYCEILKLKKSFLIWLMIFLIFGLNLTYFLTRINDSVLGWNGYILNTEMILFSFLGIILFFIATGHIICREYTEKTVSILYTYPISRVKIFIGKCLAIVFIILLIYTLNFLFVFGGRILLLKESVTSEILLLHLKMNLYSMIFQTILVPIWVLISSISKSTSLCAILASVIAGSNVLLLSFENLQKYSPFMLPFIPLATAVKTGELNITSNNILLAACTFLFAIILCLGYYLKTDIY